MRSQIDFTLLQGVNCQKTTALYMLTQNLAELKILALRKQYSSCCFNTLHSVCYWNGILLVHFCTARFLLSEINHRPQSERHTHPLFHIKGVSVFSVLCKPVLILYTWPSGTKAQLWLIETTNKERSLSPRSLHNRRQGRNGTEIAKGQGGRPGVRAHLSYNLYTCMLTHTHARTHTDTSYSGCQALTGA